ncbi:hypothetical protein H5410_009769 [Solanum commersonii]|uniref:Uncharacterized protein n=1 Tax=Solanum commersonii TaxID=4109 RepID=A0A9J6AKM0_SOLCO|nr:hypothetical protein H5410_009769 [Solanum commersonii]
MVVKFGEIFLRCKNPASVLKPLHTNRITIGNRKGKAKGDIEEGHPQGGQAVDVTRVEILIRSCAISHLVFGILVRKIFYTDCRFVAPHVVATLWFPRYLKRSARYCDTCYGIIGFNAKTVWFPVKELLRLEYQSEKLNSSRQSSIVAFLKFFSGAAANCMSSHLHHSLSSFYLKRATCLSIRINAIALGLIGAQSLQLILWHKAISYSSCKEDKQ